MVLYLSSKDATGRWTGTVNVWRDFKMKGTITICGSTKFKKEFEAINAVLSFKGYFVFSVGSFGHSLKSKSLRKHTADQKEYLDKLYKEKITMSDAIFVINPNNYIGSSTYSEIQHAVDETKKIYFLSEELTNQRRLLNDIDIGLFERMMLEE
jgi:hypothetical protein